MHISTLADVQIFFSTIVPTFLCGVALKHKIKKTTHFGTVGTFLQKVVGCRRILQYDEEKQIFVWFTSN